MKILGSNLRIIRKFHERKQDDIAKSIGISTRQYRKMENDDIEIRSKYLFLLANVYGISVEVIENFTKSTIIQKEIHNPKDNFNIENNSQISYEELRNVYEKMILAKDQIIRQQQEFIEFLKAKNS